MTTNELKKLNHYPEFRTDAGIDKVINFLNTGVLLPGMNARQTAVPSLGLLAVSSYALSQEITNCSITQMQISTLKWYD